MFDKTQFYNTVAQLPRQKILEMINEDHPKLLDDDTPSLIEQIERIEAVFKYKMGHLNWADGSPIKSRDMTNFELALLVDPPFDVDPELRRRGLTAEQQYQLYVASDPVIWAREILKQEPRVYQILMLRHPNTRKVLRAGRRLGKALDVETPIPTPDGWKTMGELQIGDQVFDEFGAPCNVTGVTDYQYDRDCYEVSFSDGSSLVADADHQWTVHTKTSRKARNRTKNPQSGTVTLTTREMLDSIYVQCGNKQEVNYSIDVAGPVNYQEKNLEVDPYVFGFWLGDGCSSRGTVCVGLDDQAEVMVRIKECGYGVWNIDSSDTEVHVDGLYRGLNKLGVLKKYEKTNYNKCGGTYPGNDVEKHIPQQYLQGSIHQREELLKGLLDSDGTVDSNGYVELSLTNEGLAKDAYELIQSLGYKATFRVDKAKLYEKYCGFRYRIWFAPNRPVFKLERKLIRQVLRPQPTNRSRVRYITAITPVESRPVKCITVDSENSLYLAGKDFIPTHNSFTMALAMLHYAYTNRNGRVLVMAPMKAQVELLYTEVMRISKESENVSMAITRAVTSPQFKIEFSNGSTISFFTTGLKSGGKSDVARGQEANLIILDELDYMGPDDLVAILAMLQKTRGKQDEKTLIGASTPTGLREQFWEWCNSPEFQEFWYPSYCNPFFDEKIEKEMHNLYRDEMAYRHEIEADWGESVDGVYPRKFVDKAFMTGRMLHGPDDDIEDIKASSDWEYNDRKLDNASRFVMGVDWDKFGAGPNICVLEIPPAKIQDVRFKGKVRVIFREEIPRSEFVLNEAVKRIIQLNEVFNPDWIYVDRGFGEVQVENLHLYGIDHPESGLRQKVKGVAFGGSIDVRDPFTQQIDKKKAKIFMVENLRLLLERETIAFPSSDEELYAQLTHYVVSTSSYMGEPRFAMSSSKVLDHAHDALLLACLAFSEHYDELLVVKSSSLVLTASNQALTGVDTRSNKEHQMNVDYADEVKSGTSSIARRSRSMSGRMGTRNRVKRSNF